MLLEQDNFLLYFFTGLSVTKPDLFFYYAIRSILAAACLSMGKSSGFSSYLLGGNLPDSMPFYQGGGFISGSAETVVYDSSDRLEPILWLDESACKLRFQSSFWSLDLSSISLSSKGKIALNPRRDIVIYLTAIGKCWKRKSRRPSAYLERTLLLSELVLGPKGWWKGAAAASPPCVG